VGTGGLARPAERSSAEWPAGSISIRVEVDARNEKMNAKIRERVMTARLPRPKKVVLKLRWANYPLQQRIQKDSRIHIDLG
jgi:hypothetical protein